MATEFVSGTIYWSGFITLLELRMSSTSIPWIFVSFVALFASDFNDCFAQNVDPRAVSQLALTDVDGRSVIWADNAEVRVFCFLGVECPVARFYAARLNELAKQYADKNVVFLGINSNPHDSLSDLQKFAQDLRLGFRQIKDADQKIAAYHLVATRFSISQLAEAFGGRWGGPSLTRPASMANSTSPWNCG